MIGEAPGFRRSSRRQRQFVNQVSEQIPVGMNTEPASRLARCCHTLFASECGPCCDAPTIEPRGVSAGVFVLQISVKKITNEGHDSDPGSLHAGRFTRACRNGKVAHADGEFSQGEPVIFPGESARVRDGSALLYVVRKFTSYRMCVLNHMLAGEPGRRVAPVFQLIASLPRWLGQGAPGKQIRSWERSDEFTASAFEAVAAVV